MHERRLTLVCLSLLLAATVIAATSRGAKESEPASEHHSDYGR